VRFKGRPASIQISGFDYRNKKKSKVQYRVLLRKIDESILEFWPYGVDRIAGDATGMDLTKAKNIFSTIVRALEPPGSLILLVWIM
jgi:hypothetical protein